MVRFVGRIPELKPGFWVFVELDEPTGKNDGSIAGVRFFHTDANRGAVMRPNGVVVLSGAHASAAASAADDEL